MLMNKKVLFFVLFCISTTVFFVWMNLNQEPPPFTESEKKQALEEILGRAVREKKIVPQGKNTYAGKFFSLSYSAYAKVDDKNNPNKKILEYFGFSSEEPKFKFVVLVKLEDESAVLEELSAVKARRQSKLYQETPITIDGRKGALFVKTSDGVERSSFFLKDGKSYSFSITGTDVGELERVYGKIMESVTFSSK